MFSKLKNIHFKDDLDEKTEKNLEKQKSIESPAHIDNNLRSSPSLL